VCHSIRYVLSLIFSRYLVTPATGVTSTSIHPISSNIIWCCVQITYIATYSTTSMRQRAYWKSGAVPAS
jgi:hypothetical protein